MTSPSSLGSFFAVSSIIYFLIVFGFIGCGVYGFVLFVKLARRGIKALDIYIEKNSKNENMEQKYEEKA